MKVAAPSMDDSKTGPSDNEFNFMKQLASCGEYKFERKGSDGNMFNQCSVKNIQEQKHPGMGGVMGSQGPHVITWINFNPIMDK